MIAERGLCKAFDFTGDLNNKGAIFAVLGARPANSLRAGEDGALQFLTVEAATGG